MRACGRLGVPLTFRSGGTSLSGQALSDSVLVDTRTGFTGIEVLDDGRRVRVQPGATIRAVNTRLAPYGRKLGPDPASEVACTVGGVLANNSSGMQCGTELNSYRTVESMVVVLPSGTVVDSAAPGAGRLLAEQEPALHAGLLRLQRADPVRRRVGGHAGAAVRAEEHDGLRPQQLPGPRRPARRARPPDGGQRGHAGLHRLGGVPHRGGAPPRRDRSAGLRRPRHRVLGACPTCWPPAWPRPSSWTRSRCGWPRPTRAARRRSGGSTYAGTRRCSSSCRPTPPTRSPRCGPGPSPGWSGCP